jgi:hypothetical protein
LNFCLEIEHEAFGEPLCQFDSGPANHSAG